MQEANEARPAYRPRKQFLPFHERHQRWAVLVIHRRAGKTVASVNELIEQALYTRKRDAQYAYVAPQLKQAKRIAWEYLKRYAKHASRRVNEAELYVELINGSKIYIVGADDPDSGRGLYFDGVVIDETAQIKRSFWFEVIRPALADRRGWAVFLGTPRGKGNLLYEQRKKALAKPDSWFYLELKASETGLIGPQELAELKEEMDESEFNQEFECSFEAALIGSYYGKYISDLEKNRKVVDRELFDSNYPVSLAMDLGFNDAMAIWFWQIIKGEVRFIDYYEATGKDADEVIEMLQRLPYDYDTMWLPHDAYHKTFQSRKSVFDTFLEADLPVRRAPDPDAGNRVFHGINAVRKVLRTYPIIFSERRCTQGIECLKNYSREWNQKLGQFNDKPKHDRYSHGADAFRYACLSIQWEDIKRSADLPTPTPGIIQQITINNHYTLDRATKDHLRMIRQRANQGRPRV